MFIKSEAFGVLVGYIRINLILVEHVVQKSVFGLLLINFGRIWRVQLPGIYPLNFFEKSLSTLHAQLTLTVLCTAELVLRKGSKVVLFLFVGQIYFLSEKAAIILALQIFLWLVFRATRILESTADGIVWIAPAINHVRVVLVGQLSEANHILLN